MTDTGTPARTVRAADLPKSSVVATARRVWIAAHGPGKPLRWDGPRSWASDEEIDRALARGAEVLRYGNGQDPR